MIKRRGTIMDQDNVNEVEDALGVQRGTFAILPKPSRVVENAKLYVQVGFFFTDETDSDRIDELEAECRDLIALIEDEL
jgi:hypothetical protein